MTPHLSLAAPMLKIDSIRPVETMGVYELCWCRSGKKYKWCHFRRDRQQPINAYATEAKMLAELREGFCSYPDPAADPCSSTIAKSHSVQKRGGLSAIAENGHVLTVKPTIKELIKTDGHPQPRLVGVNNASVFPGFCGKHDTSVFKAVEGKSLSLDENAAFLLSYRAIAYESFAKQVQVKHIEILRETDRGRSFATQAALQMMLCDMLAGVHLGLKDMARWKGQFDERLISGSRKGFHFTAVRFDGILPIVACCAFHPEFDFSGRALQDLGKDGVDMDHIALTVTAFEDQTVAVFGWIGDETGPAQDLTNSFFELSDAEKADALVRLLFIHAENLFIRPSWWDALPDSDKAALTALILSGTPIKMRNGAEMAGDARQIFSVKVAELVRN